MASKKKTEDVMCVETPKAKYILEKDHYNKDAWAHIRASFGIDQMCDLIMVFEDGHIETECLFEPCPLCGSYAQGYNIDSSAIIPRNTGYGYTIMCSNEDCRCMVRHTSARLNVARVKAMEAWSRRTNEQD